MFETRTVWEQMAGATMTHVPYRHFEHECYWGPAFNVRTYQDGGCRPFESETLAIPHPRFVCAHGLLSSGVGAERFTCRICYAAFPTAGLVHDHSLKKHPYKKLPLRGEKEKKWRWPASGTKGARWRETIR